MKSLNYVSKQAVIYFAWWKRSAICVFLNQTVSAFSIKVYITRRILEIHVEMPILKAPTSVGCILCLSRNNKKILRSRQSPKELYALPYDRQGNYVKSFIHSTRDLKAMQIMLCTSTHLFGHQWWFLVLTDSWFYGLDIFCFFIYFFWENTRKYVLMLLLYDPSRKGKHPIPLSFILLFCYNWSNLILQKYGLYILLQKIDRSSRNS